MPPNLQVYVRQGVIPPTDEFVEYISHCESVSTVYPKALFLSHIK